MHVTGGCHCGNLSYEAEIDPEKVALCHCTDCQIFSGSAFSTFVMVPKEKFRLLAGRPATYVKTAESGARRAQAFCPVCGTRIYAAAEIDPQAFNIRVGTLRQRAQLRPRLQIWCRSALDWVSKLDAVPALDTQVPR